MKTHTSTPSVASVPSHTPGPWNYVMDGFRFTIGNAKTSNTTTPHDYMVAEIPDNSFQAEANARLIAAAPDLLAALKMCEDVIGWARLEGKLSDNALSPVNDALVAAGAAIDKTR